MPSPISNPLYVYNPLFTCSRLKPINQAVAAAIIVAASPAAPVYGLKKVTNRIKAASTLRLLKKSMA